MSDENENNEGEEEQDEKDDGEEEQVGKDGKPFDAERAQRTIETLRAEERRAKKLDKELEAARAKLKEIEDADKSELEKARDHATELEAKLEREAERRKSVNTRLTAHSLAAELGIADADLALAAVTDVEYDEDGEPTNLRERLEAACEKHPALKTPAKTPKPKLDGGSGGNNDDEGPELTAAQLEAAKALKMTPEDYVKFGSIKNIEEYERARSAA